MKKVIVDIILTFFLAISALLIFMYMGLLIEKIMRPEFKNASWGLLTASGLLILGFAICDFYILRHFFRIPKKD